jgi:hypothetical protein
MGAGRSPSALPQQASATTAGNARVSASLQRISQGLNGTTPALWIYVSTDSDLSGTYFSAGVQRGLKVNDLVMGIDTNGLTTKMYRRAQALDYRR